MVEGSSVHYVRRWRGKDHAMVMSGANVDGVVTGSGDIGQSSSNEVPEQSMLSNGILPSNGRFALATPSLLRLRGLCQSISFFLPSPWFACVNIHAGEIFEFEMAPGVSVAEALADIFL
ncbi:hypothetical protein U1Q18_042876 [Sarracenia purpurea var. burkii]